MRHEAYHSEGMRDRWREELIGEGQLLRAAIRGKLPITRNPSICNMPWSMPCPYRRICIDQTPEAHEHDFRKVSDPHIEVVEAANEQEL